MSKRWGLASSTFVIGPNARRRRKVSPIKPLPAHPHWAGYPHAAQPVRCCSAPTPGTPAAKTCSTDAQTACPQEPAMGARGAATRRDKRHAALCPLQWPSATAPVRDSTDPAISGPPRAPPVLTLSRLCVAGHGRRICVDLALSLSALLPPAPAAYAEPTRPTPVHNTPATCSMCIPCIASVSAAV